MIYCLQFSLYHSYGIIISCCFARCVSTTAVAVMFRSTFVALYESLLSTPDATELSSCQYSLWSCFEWAATAALSKCDIIRCRYDVSMSSWTIQNLSLLTLDAHSLPHPPPPNPNNRPQAQEQFLKISSFCEWGAFRVYYWCCKYTVSEKRFP